MFLGVQSYEALKQELMNVHGILKDTRKIYVVYYHTELGWALREHPRSGWFVYPTPFLLWDRSVILTYEDENDPETGEHFVVELPIVREFKEVTPFGFERGF